MRRAWLCFVALLPLVSSAVADEPVVAVDYAKQIKPLLKARCYACHGALKQESGLRLDTAESARRGGEGGAVIVPGDPAASPLVARVASTDEGQRMPPQGLGTPLSADEQALVRRWIETGAVGPADEAPEPDPRDHWAFRAPVRAPLPPVQEGVWGRNPIDFLAALEHHRAGVSPVAPASPEILLRRVYLDLIGLPPTREELRAFVEDPSDEAWQRVVTRLLESPQYGERWARHWMDVWRYADWHGRRQVPDVWNSAPQVWRWRDWIVGSLNQDKGYDQMVREMLAGDELAPEDDSVTVATGYLVRNWYALNHNQWMRDNVEHSAKAFLGLTFNCCHCHDHKYDPLRQEDYFRLRAFFEPLGVRQDRVAGESEPGIYQEYDYLKQRPVVRLGAVRAYDRIPDAPTWFYTGGDERNRQKDRGPVAPGFPLSLAGAPLPMEPLELSVPGYYPGYRASIQATEIAQRREGVARAEANLPVVHRAIAEALPALRVALDAANVELDRVVASQVSGQPAALAGRQSLKLDATSGRRILHNHLPGLKTFPHGTTLRFELKILVDAHFNFQLARHVTAGLTAGVVFFEKGQIRSYQPGGFHEFEVARYDITKGQYAFAVSLEFEPGSDRCLLTVISLSDKRTLAERVPVALNSWNPVGDPTKAITLDARTGSVVAIDSLTVHVPGEPAAGAVLGTPNLVFSADFEAPTYSPGADVLGIDGWSLSPLAQAGATSRVGALHSTPELEAASANYRIANSAVLALELSQEAAKQKLAAETQSLAAVQARIAADRLRYGGSATLTSVKETSATGTQALEEATRQASQLERQAALESAKADWLAGRRDVAAAEAKPTTDEARAKELDAGQKRLAAAQSAMEKASVALANADLDKVYSPLSPVYGTQSTGRRRALAQWITRRENPLTARVAVNHIWLRHFHQPLVASVFDLGRNGARPTHPALLDFLAVELMESGWSMKRLHRLIVSSELYRMSSSGRMASSGTASDNLLRDPDNRLLWRMPLGRMEAEVVRDSVLACCGNLELTLGGQELENTEALTTRRRSLYYSCHPESGGKSPFGELFDGAEPSDCYRRTRSIMPQQALILTNSTMIHEQSARLAGQLWQGLSAAEQSDPALFVIAAYEQILSRRPSQRERELCQEFLQNQAVTIRAEGGPEPEPRAREGLIRALFNHNDFVTIH